MKILHVETGRHFYGGAEQVVWLAAGLNERGVENKLVCLPGSAIEPIARDAGIEVATLSCAGDLDLGFAWRLRQLLEQESPDIVHCHSRRGADFLGGQAAAMAGIPAVVSRRVDSVEKGALAALRYRPFRRVIAISAHIAGQLLAGGLSKDRLAVIRSAVDAKNLPHTADRTLLEHEFGVQPQQFAIAIAAQLIRRKGHTYLFEALAGGDAKLRQVRLLVFGTGPLQTELRKRVERMGLAETIRFAGFRRDLDAMLPAFDLLVHPATSEGLGVAMLKAAAAALPVIAFDVAGAREAVDPETTGILVPVADVPALRRAIVRLVDDPELRAAFGNAGRQRMLGEFSIDNMVDQHIRLYEDIARD